MQTGTGARHDGYKGAYLPKCVEEKFCELRLNGVLRSSLETFLDLEIYTGAERVGKRHRLTYIEPHPAKPEGGEVQALHVRAS